MQSRGLTSSPDQAAWLDELIAGLRLPAVHAVGVSIGGWLAFNLAVRVPGRLASVILLEPAITFGRGDLERGALAWCCAGLVPVVAGERSQETTAAACARLGAQSPVAALVAAEIGDFKGEAAETPPIRPTIKVAVVDILVLVVIVRGKRHSRPGGRRLMVCRPLRHGRLELLPGWLT